MKVVIEAVERTAETGNPAYAERRARNIVMGVDYLTAVSRARPGWPRMGNCTYHAVALLDLPAHPALPAQATTVRTVIAARSSALSDLAAPIVRRNAWWGVLKVQTFAHDVPSPVGVMMRRAAVGETVVQRSRDELGRVPEGLSSPASILQMQRLAGNRAVTDAIASMNGRLSGGILPVVQRCGPDHPQCGCTGEAGPTQAAQERVVSLQRTGANAAVRTPLGGVEANSAVQRSRLVVRDRTLIVQRRGPESDFPQPGRFEEVRPGEFLLWNFGVGKANLKPEHQAALPAILVRIQDAFKANGKSQVDVEGIASATGSDKRNDALARARSDAAVRALTGQGVPSDRIHETSVGKRKALPDISTQNLARSRAVRIIIVEDVRSGRRPTGQSGADLSSCRVTTSRLELHPQGKVFYKDGDLSAGDPSTPGMNFDATLTLNRPVCKGARLQLVQNVRPFHEFVYKDGSRCRLETDGFVLDTSDPFGGTLFPGPNFQAMVAEDSPHQTTGRIGDPAFTEGSINSLEVRDDFIMYLLFQPEPGKRQVLRSARWSWTGQALNDNTAMGKGSLSLDGSVSSVIVGNPTGVPDSTFPILSPNVKDLRFVVDRAGLPGNETLADLFVRILTP